MFVLRVVRRIVSYLSVSKIIIFLSFRVGTSRNKNIDHQVKETCAIMSTQVTCNIFVFYVLCCNLKERDIK